MGEMWQSVYTAALHPLRYDGTGIASTEVLPLEPLKTRDTIIRVAVTFPR